MSDADITIADDDGAPTGISLAVDTDADTAGDQNTVAEDGTAQTVTVRATLEGGTTRTTATAVTVTVAAGTATATTDYSVTVASPFTITIPASAASATGTFTITPVDDAIDEPDETLAVTGSTTVQGLTVTAADPALTITDAEATPTATLALTPDTIDETDQGGSSHQSTVTATLSGASSAATTITVSASAVSPAVAGDFTLSTNTELTIAAGETTSTGAVTITAVDNSVDAADKSVTVSGDATNSVGVTDPADQTLTITDDEGAPTVTLVLTPSSISENGGVSTVTATLSGASSAATTLTVSAVPVSPAVAGDFTLSTNTELTIAAGATTSTGTVTITAVDNAVDAADKQVTVSATAANDVGVTAPASQTLTITDDDAAPVPAAPTDLTCERRRQTATLDRSRVRWTAPPGAVTGYQVGAAFTGVSEGIAPPVDSDFTILSNDDTSYNHASQRNRRFHFRVRASNAAGWGEWTDTCVNDPLLGLRVADAEVVEGDSGTTSLQFTVGFDEAVSSRTTFEYDTSDGTATAGTDYTAVTDGEGVIADGETETTIAITVSGDTVSEPDETFTLEINSLSRNVRYGTSDGREVTVTGTILNDDAGITVTLPQGQTSLTTTEAGGEATFTVVLDSAPTADVTISVSSDDTGEGTVAPATLTFTSQNWNTAQTVTVTGVDDAVDDGDQDYSIVLAAAQSTDTNYSGIDPDDVSVTNTDDDAAPTAISLRLAPATVTEGGGAQTVTVHADVQGSTTFGSDTEVTVSAGTATVTDDYAVSTAPGTITIAPGGPPPVRRRSRSRRWTTPSPSPAARR